ncbi:DNA gyrase inhibitor YacG [Paracoccus aerodenitrificans]|uniref:DNA gyrase inhibitor YacG n=1 Tax=Paracoccus aerodenitrificans TaxID=3017781 RepID=UPI0022F0EBF4|nr:DNA gyrase inhibitor YacG [Paracoccus aerodenitrificans]WBU64183.1 DNA gyrase inhibitor YacG [Paracoccus aerodenitrificans]
MMSRCPICKKPSAEAYRLFCSKRCADVDLAHWLRGDYVIPGDSATSSEAGEEE